MNSTNSTVVLKVVQHYYMPHGVFQKWGVVLDSPDQRVSLKQHDVTNYGAQFKPDSMAATNVLISYNT